MNHFGSIGDEQNQVTGFRTVRLPMVRSGESQPLDTKVASLKPLAEFEQLDLAYSPPFATVWDPLLIAAQQLMKEL